jgi:PTS system fructose-specific IIC component
MTTLITPALVSLDTDLGPTSPDVIRALVDRVVDTGRADDARGLLDDALAREGQAATGLPGGIGIPHCRSTHVLEPTLAFARLAPPVNFGAPDGPADLIFLIAAPAGGDATHLQLLTALARALVRKEFVAALRAATTQDDVVRLVGEAVAPAKAAQATSAPATSVPATSAEATTAAADDAGAGAAPA